jgi:hypothetical protein
MRNGRRFQEARLVIGLWVILAVIIPTTAYADGGIITEDVEVWEQIEEGEQIAVVHLSEGDTAKVELFVSLQDTGSTSHEVKFFVPLGQHPIGFDVVEQSSADFKTTQINELNMWLRIAARDTMKYQQKVRSSLLGPGLLLVPGGTMFFVAFTLVEELFDATASGFGDDGVGGRTESITIAPLMTLQTEHSSIEVYELEEGTSVEALIATTGLHRTVRGTLRRYKGQQIAVITLQTQPGSEQGLHLSWESPLTGRRARYAYPLGTGSAWSRPIELNHQCHRAL